MRHPQNNLAPWKVTTDTGSQVSIEDDGLHGDTVTAETIKFSDGSTLTTAVHIAPQTQIDGGIF